MNVTVESDEERKCWTIAISPTVSDEIIVFIIGRVTGYESHTRLKNIMVKKI